MHRLEKIYWNTIGSVFIIKNDDDTYNSEHKIQQIQLQLTDIAVILTKTEFKALHRALKSFKVNCNCKTCGQSSTIKILKSKTKHAEIVFKVEKKHITALVELLNGAKFNLEMIQVLQDHNIKA